MSRIRSEKNPIIVRATFNEMELIQIKENMRREILSAANR